MAVANSAEETCAEELVLDVDECAARMRPVGRLQERPSNNQIPVLRLSSAEAISNDKFASHNLHDWCANQATRRGVSLCAAMGFMMLSLIFVCLQVILLASVILESSFHRCVNHKNCKLGEWCSPALGGSFSTSPGVCFDCWSAKMFYDARFLNASYETYPDPYEDMAEAAGDEWLLAGSRHCNNTDSYPRRCDHLAQSLDSLTPLNLLVFIAVAIMIVGPILDEVDEAFKTANFTMHRTMYMHHGFRRRIVVVLTETTSELRRWALPMMTIGAGLGLLLGASLSAQNLLLNGIAITFVTTMDNTLCWIFIKPQPDEEEPPIEYFPTAIWLLHRLYSLGLFIVIVVTVRAAEQLLSTHGNEKKYGAVCSDIREIVTLHGFHVCFSFALVSAPLQFSLRWCDKKCALRVEQQRRMLCEGYAAWPRRLSPEQWYRAHVLAKILCCTLGPPWMVYVVRNAFVAQGPMVMLQIGDGMKTMGVSA